MADYTPHNRPGEQGAYEHVRETTVIHSGNSTGVMAAVVLFILLAVAGFVFWTADDSQTINTTAPGAEINEQVAPDAQTARPTGNRAIWTSPWVPIPSAAASRPSISTRLSGSTSNNVHW